MFPKYNNIICIEFTDMSKSQLFGKLILLLFDEFLLGVIYTEKISQGGISLNTLRVSSSRKCKNDRRKKSGRKRGNLECR